MGHKIGHSPLATLGGAIQFVAGITLSPFRLHGLPDRTPDPYVSVRTRSRPRIISQKDCTSLYLRADMPRSSSEKRQTGRIDGPHQADGKKIRNKMVTRTTLNPMCGSFWIVYIAEIRLEASLATADRVAPPNLGALPDATLPTGYLRPRSQCFTSFYSAFVAAMYEGGENLSHGAIVLPSPTHQTHRDFKWQPTRRPRSFSQSAP